MADAAQLARTMPQPAPDAEEVQEYSASSAWIPPRSGVPRAPGPHKVPLAGEPFVPERTPQISFGEPKTITNEMAFFNDHYPIPVSHRTPDLDNRYAAADEDDDGVDERNSPGRRRVRPAGQLNRGSLDSVRMSADGEELGEASSRVPPRALGASFDGTSAAAVAGPSRSGQVSASWNEGPSSLVAATLRRQFKNLMDEVLSKHVGSLPPLQPFPAAPSSAPAPAPAPAPTAPSPPASQPPTTAPADLRGAPSTPSQASVPRSSRSSSPQRAAAPGRSPARSGSPLDQREAIDRLEEELRARLSSEQAAAVAVAEEDARAARARARELEVALDESRATAELQEATLMEELASLRNQLRRLKSGSPIGDLMAHFDADVDRLQNEVRRLTEENAALLSQLERAHRHPPPPPQSPGASHAAAQADGCCTPAAAAAATTAAAATGGSRSRGPSPSRQRSPSPTRTRSPERAAAGEGASAGELAALWRQVADTCVCRHRPPSALFRALAAANRRVGELHAELNSLRRVERSDAVLKKAWGDTAKSAKRAQRELEARGTAIVERDLALVQMQTLIKEAALRESKLRDENAEMAGELRRLKDVLERLEAERSHAARYLGRSQRALQEVHTGAAQTIAGLFERLDGELVGNLNPKAKNTLRRLRGEFEALEGNRAELARQQQRVVKEMMKWASASPRGGADDCACDEKLAGGLTRPGRPAGPGAAALAAIQNILMPQTS
eukprot:tig00020538_g10358.t1